MKPRTRRYRALQQTVQFLTLGGFLFALYAYIGWALEHKTAAVIISGLALWLLLGGWQTVARKVGSR